MENNLSKLNIENLFPNSNNCGNNFHGRLDINSLFQNHTKEFNFNSNVLLEGIHKKRKALQEHYNNIYKICCETIMAVNKSGLTDITYEIPLYSECVGYNCIECLNFLKDKLKQQKLGARIVAQTKIFITWHDLEKRIVKNDI